MSKDIAGPKLCLVAWSSFFPSRWETALYIRERYKVQFAVVAPPRAKVPPVYDPSGYLSPSSAGLKNCPPFVTLISLNNAEHPSSGFKTAELRAFLDRYKPDLIWIHDEALSQTTLSICKWYWLSRKAKIYTPAHSHLQRLAIGLRDIKNWVLLQRITGFMARSTWAVTQVHKDFRIPLKKIFVTYHANLAVNRSARPRPDHRQFRIGFAGRLAPEKGTSVLLEALDMLPSDIRLFTAGSGEEDVMRSLEAHPRVHHMGLLPELSELFSEIDLLIVPSLTTPTWREQFGRVIAEAFSCGIPVVGSDSGAIPEVVGNGGLIYPERSAKALSDHILKLYSDRDLYRQLSANGKRRFAMYFSVEASARRLASIFNLRPR